MNYFLLAAVDNDKTTMTVKRWKGYNPSLTEISHAIEDAQKSVSWSNYILVGEINRYTPGQTLPDTNGD